MIVMTVEQPEQVEGMARELEAAAFLQNPVKADELTATIREVLDKKE